MDLYQLCILVNRIFLVETYDYDAVLYDANLAYEGWVHKGKTYPTPYPFGQLVHGV